jgi:hypothetical protein
VVLLESWSVSPRDGELAGVVTATTPAEAVAAALAAVGER